MYIEIAKPRIVMCTALAKMAMRLNAMVIKVVAVLLFLAITESFRLMRQLFYYLDRNGLESSGNIPARGDGGNQTLAVARHSQ